ncbi:MAG: helix-turn-helix domain-containing protein [Oscillospiraceae bacterium]|nr:helix-turn-helix domain-containing protein [Oscillospiraceae bacterium]
MASLRLRELREGKKLNQADVAAYLQIARTTYARYETGEREMTYNSLVSLAELFSVSVDYLLGRFDANPVILCEDEAALIDMFRTVDERGQTSINAIVRHEYLQSKKAKKHKT